MCAHHATNVFIGCVHHAINVLKSQPMYLARIYSMFITNSLFDMYAPKVSTNVCVCHTTKVSSTNGYKVSAMCVFAKQLTYTRHATKTNMHLPQKVIKPQPMCMFFAQLMCLHRATIVKKVSFSRSQYSKLSTNVLIFSRSHYSKFSTYEFSKLSMCFHLQPCVVINHTQPMCNNIHF